ncbi:enoyl-CoA hydratase/isomerase family protein [Nocardia sp. XZ_19_385]|uniref:enoyl-CoA hydratase/isomerase family protein n=1 Tax=Nocardia sp. XZ_19_385 TaxID=2769488 RepID=UPI00188F6EEC|nr:enoyl-CoA hydratase/isomerase family protein [Nocardia sp. XZ_19_385]
MPETLSDWDGRAGSSRFEEYAHRYRDFFVMTRRGGILEMRMHTDGGPLRHSWIGHNAWNQAWLEVGNDPDNEVLILTGTGNRWHSGDPGELWRTPFPRWSPDSQLKMHSDMVKLLENLAFAIDIPTIAAVNGPGTHCEFATLCDITLCVEDADFFDPHFLAGAVPGDGMGLTLQQTIGAKRASYYMYTGKPIDGRTALQLGLVNEVLPRAELLPRAWEIAEMIMRRPRVTRRLTHAIAIRPWKQALVNDLGFHTAHQLWSMSMGEGGRMDLLRELGDRVTDEANS